MESALYVLWPIAGYLLGSIPFGPIFARAKGVDLRSVGSGNIGATNVARALGKKIGLLVLFLDALKGFAPVLAARLLVGSVRGGEIAVVATGLAAFLGHLFPLFLRFKGGKGVATALGVFLALAPLAALGGVAVYGVVYALTRTSSLGSLLGAVAFLPLLYVVSHRNVPFFALGCVLVVAIIATHRQNIRRLIRREEGKV